MKSNKREVEQALKKDIAELIERVITTYFKGESDKLLLKLFRSLREPHAQLILRNKLTDKESVIALSENPADLTRNEDIFGVHFEKFRKANPKFDGLKQADSIKKFLLAYQSEGLPYSNFSNQDKVDILEATKSGLAEYVSIKQDEGFKKFIQPIVEHQDILIDKHIRKQKNEVEKKKEFYLMPLFHISKIENIAEHLSLKGIIRSPKLFVSLCNGEDVMIEVVRGKHQEFFFLYKNHIYRKAVKLNKGKGYLQYMAEHISDFSNNLKSSTVSQYLLNLSNEKAMDANTVLALGKIIDSILQ